MTAYTLPSRVIAACEQLGEAASGRKVRAVLGGGSLRDITPLVSRWKTQRGFNGRAARAESALRAAHVRNSLLDRVIGTLDPSALASASVAPDSTWRKDLAGLRDDVAQLTRSITAARAEPAVIAIEPRPGRELNAALEHIDKRLTDLEASIESHGSPALAVADAVRALVERLDTLSCVVQRLAGDAVANGAEHTSVAKQLDQRLAGLTLGQEALASTIGFCAERTIAPVLDTLERLDRRQVARLQRVRAAIPSSSTPPRKKKRHVR